MWQEPGTKACGQDFTVTAHRDSPDWYSEDKESKVEAMRPHMHRLFFKSLAPPLTLTKNMAVCIGIGILIKAQSTINCKALIIPQSCSMEAFKRKETKKLLDDSALKELPTVLVEI